MILSLFCSSLVPPSLCRFSSVLAARMNPDRHFHTYEGLLTVPELPEVTNRADVVGSSPVCVGGSASLDHHFRQQYHHRVRSPPISNTSMSTPERIPPSHRSIGHPLYYRSRSPSPSFSSELDRCDGPEEDGEFHTMSCC